LAIQCLAHTTDFDENEEEDLTSDDMMMKTKFEWIPKPYPGGDDEYDEFQIMMILMKRWFRGC
jgi:hypothetical protein